MFMDFITMCSRMENDSVLYRISTIFTKRENSSSIIFIGSIGGLNLYRIELAINMKHNINFGVIEGFSEVDKWLCEEAA